MTTPMIERPILFSTPMVQAILDGRKTQTRRIVKPQPPEMYDRPYLYPVARSGCEATHIAWHTPKREPTHPNGGTTVSQKLRCQIGDQLWVRETWARPPFIDLEGEYGNGVIYKADDPHDLWEAVAGKWRPSIHMPKWAARIWLEVTGIKVERVQDINLASIWAEGRGMPDDIDDSTEARQREWVEAPKWFRELWTSINGKDSWESNPWVWVIEFKVLSTNGRPK